jgi:AcrR family transcriptional regulator
MSTSKSRSYTSAVREHQAAATRQRILEATRKLMATRGFEGASIAAIAKSAKVAVPTVYATFGSKRGIVSALLDNARFGPAYQEHVSKARQSEDPAERLRFAAGIARRIFDAERDEVAFLWKTGAIAPELAVKQKDLERRRHTAQQSLIELLAKSGRLREGLAATTAGDILWTLTSQAIYTQLVAECNWTSQRYEDWLADALIRELLSSGQTKPK